MELEPPNTFPWGKEMVRSPNEWILAVSKGHENFPLYKTFTNPAGIFR